MTQRIRVIKKNETHMVILASSVGVDQELNDFFSFLVPNHQFMRAYKMKMWDGKHRLYNIRSKELPLGLYPYLEKFCEDREYELDFDDDVIPERLDITDEEFKEFIVSLKLPYELRDYQEQSIREALSASRTLILSPTGSGKSLILYCLIRWYQQQDDNFKTLLIVPTTSLVEQMSTDFLDYAQNDDSFGDKDIHKIYQGQDKNTSKAVVISTWQSLYTMPAVFFRDYSMIIGDEAHQAKAQSLTKIISNCVNAKYRFGTTGTLDKLKVHKLTLEGLFGATHQATTTEKLMSRGDLAKLSINCILLQYSDEDRKFCKNLNYADEVTWIHAHPERNELLAKLSVRMKGNTLVAFKHIKHGKILYKRIKELVGDKRTVFFVDGSTKVDLREQTRQITEISKDAIIVASLGVFSTGINIKNLNNIIFTTPSKSRIRVLQSIGRVLRVGTSSSATLYDIADDLCWKKHKNFSFKHFIDRLNIYIEEKFVYKLHKLTIERRKDVPLSKNNQVS